LYKAESASITVSDGSIDNGSGLAVTVSPASTSSLALAATSTTPTAGAADNVTLTARDAYGNTATGYTGDKNLTFGGAATIGSFHPTATDKSSVAVNFGSATTITFAAGTASGTMKLYKAESTSITV